MIVIDKETGIGYSPVQMQFNSSTAIDQRSVGFFHLPDRSGIDVESRNKHLRLLLGWSRHPE